MVYGFMEPYPITPYSGCHHVLARKHRHGPGPARRCDLQPHPALHADRRAGTPPAAQWPGPGTVCSGSGGVAVAVAPGKMADLEAGQRPDAGDGRGDPRFPGVVGLGHANLAGVPRRAGQRFAAAVRGAVRRVAFPRTAFESILGLRRIGQCAGTRLCADQRCRQHSGR
ncbi:hypothetical protein D3C78_1159990 [compost metagenome]